MVDEQSIYHSRLTLSFCSKAFCQKPFVWKTFGWQHGLAVASFSHHNFQYISNQTKYGKRACLMRSLSISHVYSHNPTLYSCSKTFCQKPNVWKTFGWQPLSLLVVTTFNTTVIWSGILFYATLDKCPTAQWFLTKTMDKLERFLRVCSFTAVIKFNC
jgi:hypothetical protein